MTPAMTVSISGVKRGVVAAAAVGALLLAGCSSDVDEEGSADSTAVEDDTSKTTVAPDEEDGVSEEADGSEEKSVENFCATLNEIARDAEQEAPQDGGYESQLQATAPEEIAPVVDDLADASEEVSALGEPTAELQERALRSIFGIVVYANNECDDTAGFADAFGLDDEGVEILNQYTLEDIQDDDTWKKISDELGISAALNSD